MGTEWTQVTDETATGDWTTTFDGYTTEDQREWRTVLNSNAAKKDTFLGLTEAAENFSVNPEDVELEPELTQADRDEWTVEPEAT